MNLIFTEPYRDLGNKISDLEVGKFFYLSTYSLKLFRINDDYGLIVIDTEEFAFEKDDKEFSEKIKFLKTEDGIVIPRQNLDNIFLKALPVYKLDKINLSSKYIETIAVMLTSEEHSFEREFDEEKFSSMLYKKTEEDLIKMSISQLSMLKSLGELNQGMMSFLKPEKESIGGGIAYELMLSSILKEKILEFGSNLSRDLKLSDLTSVYHACEDEEIDTEISLIKSNIAESISNSDFRAIELKEIGAERLVFLLKQMKEFNNTSMVEKIKEELETRR